MKPWMLAEANYAYIKQQTYDVAVLPLGATEPHNLHLPYGTDVFEASIVGDKICEAAHNAGAKVILLPTIPFGTETNLRSTASSWTLSIPCLTTGSKKLCCSTATAETA